MKNIRYNISAAESLWLLLFTVIIGFILVGLASMLLPADTVVGLRIGSVVQQVSAFIAPAIVCAMISTRRPDIMLRLRGKFSGAALLWTVVVMIVSIPAMEALIRLNNALPLPEGVDQFLRSLEDNAATVTATMMGDHTVGNLIVNLLIMAVMTGFSEEILFRGALCDALSRTRLGATGAIWVGAAIFSLMHMQIFGFFPRMLLGAFFGYLLLRSGSLWLGVIAHALNNGLYIITAYCGFSDAAVDSTPLAITIIAVSTALTAVAFLRLRRCLSSPDANCLKS